MLVLNADDVQAIDLDNPAEGYVCERWALGPPEIRELVNNRTLANGTRDRTRYIGARSLVMTVVVFPARGLTVQGQVDRLRAFCRPELRPTLTWRVRADPTRQITLRANPGVDQAWAWDGGQDEWTRVGLAFVVPDGLMHSEATFTRTIEASSGAEDGRRYNEAPVLTPPSPPLNMFTHEQATMEVNYSASAAPAITRACGWFANGGTAEWSTDHAAVGTHSVKVLKTASAGWLAPAPTTLSSGNAGHACAPGEKFTFMGQFWGIGVTQVGLQLNFFNAAGAIITNPVTYFPVATTAWTALRQTFVTPADAVRCLPQPTQNTAVGNGWYMDQMAFYRGDVTEWYDPADAWAQNILLPDAPTPRTELATFETNVNTGTGRVSGWQSWGGGSTAVWSTEQAAEGTHSLKSSNPGAAVGQTYAPRSAGSTTAYYPAKPFATYTFAFSAFPVTQDSAAQIQVRFNDATGTQLTIPVSTFIGLPGEWRHCVAQFTAPANTATIGQLLMSCWITAANGVVYFDRCALFEGSVGAWHHPDEPAPGTATGAYGRAYSRRYPPTETLGVTVINPGDVAVTWTGRIYGPCVNPLLANDTTGQLLYFDANGGLTLGPGEFIDLDAWAHTVTQDGANRFDRLNLAESEWWLLQPGNNTIRFTPDEFSPGSVAEISWRQAWL